MHLYHSLHLKNFFVSFWCAQIIFLSGGIASSSIEKQGQTRSWAFASAFTSPTLYGFSCHQHDACYSAPKHLQQRCDIRFAKRSASCGKLYASAMNQGTKRQRRNLDTKTFTLPHEIKIGIGEKLVIRHLEEADLEEVVQMCVDEYGSYSNSGDESSSSSFFPWEEKLDEDVGEQKNKGRTTANGSMFPREVDISDKLRSTESKWLEDQFLRYENWAFALFVRIGLEQRVQRRIVGEKFDRISQDHNVLCLQYINESHEKTNREVIGIAEISVQPSIPTRTSPPFVYPNIIKRAISLEYNVQQKKTSLSSSLVPYVSNVLVKDSYRGSGYGGLLMKACEGQTRSMGYDEITLHVDANERSGKTAQNLYLGLGYKPIVDTEDDYSAIQGGGGVYFVEGVPLLYLKKILR